ncbi:glycoside hydrolase family 2 TIM barrel-domain containing protein [Dyadobacter sp. CY323]|uniref:glycoside hydrolase family 2 TIM barrel-domain containing protein n=1 Tax=Dyadobacter sp. CY323 TaxID=2907302 RepID=UPI001F1A0636|nr:glycoside hydrolase family 2 TIM barrel-domain containing protein [Dyadobacter sp. CY323]MCE6992048.1 DUF4982 domain-containing protein [Dyadobacter sp. CY323]
MKTILLAACLLIPVLAKSQVKIARKQLFNADWVFLKDSTIQAEKPGYDDKSWRKLDLPHDWSIEDLPNQSTDRVIGPFSRESVGGTSTGYTVGGTGWYRKSFTLGNAEKNKQISIHFEGSYMETDVWLNGRHLGFHPNGYTPYSYDLTKYLLPTGQKNVLAVRVKNIGQNTRWYTGSGLYRHVWLNVIEPVHIAEAGLVITTPEVSEMASKVRVKVNISHANGSKFPLFVETTLLSPAGMQVKDIKTTATASSVGGQEITVAKPALWSPETPHLYQAKVVLISGKKRLDSLITSFGIRSIRFNAKEGFVLNGKRVLLKGGCVHHDNGPLGAVAIDRAEERKAELLKANGFNAVRSSHNPPSTSFLDACDRLGLLVIDEAFDMWQHPKKPQDYHRFFAEWWQRDLAAMIERDRNHPSVIMWSIGNEIFERADSSGLRITKNLVDEAHRLDPTRPVTEALCVFWQHPGKTWTDSDPAFALLDVGGYNYEWKNYESDHARHPNRVILGTETFASEALENWNMVEKHPYVIGDFVWTAMDYMGETAIGHTLSEPKSNKDKIPAVLPWPWYNAWCGDLDLIGFKKPQSYYRDVVWRNRAVTMAVHSGIPEGMKESVTNWGWPDEHQSWSWAAEEGKPMQVRVFSRSPLVRLELNGKLIGEQTIADSTITAVFTVPYQPGELKARSFDKGNESGSFSLKTAGKPSRLSIKADRSAIKADRNDLSYVAVEVVDDSGNVVAGPAVQVSFELRGNAELAGAGNANPTGPASFQRSYTSTFRGRCLAIVRPKGSKGSVVLKAAAPGLESAELRLEME